MKWIKFAYTIIPIHLVLHEIHTSHAEIFQVHFVFLYLNIALLPIMMQTAVNKYGGTKASGVEKVGEWHSVVSRH